jgi:hypothetical protein
MTTLPCPVPDEAASTTGHSSWSAGFIHLRSLRKESVQPEGSEMHWRISYSWAP